MNTLRNLKVGVRLSLGFGALAAGLVIVAVTSLLAMQGLRDDAHKLAHRDLQTTGDLGGLAQVSEGAGHLTAQHLYTFDGDLKTQDAVAKQIETFVAEGDKKFAEMQKLLKGTSAEPALREFAPWHFKFNAVMRKAIKASREETVAGVEERTKSRTIYLEEFVPTWQGAAPSAIKLTAAIAKLGQAQTVEAEAAAASGRRTILLVALLALAAAAALCVWITRSITRPVAEIGNRLESLNDHCVTDLTTGIGAVAEGDLTYDVQAVTKPVEVRASDELGRLSATFNQMLAKMQTSIGSYNDMREQLGALVRQVSQNAGTVSATSQQMATTSSETGRAVDEVAHAVGEVAQGAERQVQMVESVRAAAQDAARVAGESAESARETAEAASQARAMADEGVGAAQVASEVMGHAARSSAEVGEAIKELSQRSERIGGIVDTITGIAEQTNLLALNAAIEAARAGEQGRGFAVVAEEVRKLAEESQAAAGEISGLIGEIQRETSRVVDVVGEGAQRTQDGVATVEQTREAFERIGAAVADINDRIGDIAGAAGRISAETERMQADVSEVASVAEQSAASTQQVSASTQQTSASAQQIAASAADLARTAEDLEHAVRRFKVAG
jgi:methyl-accepting chemotaxis protein